MSISKTIINDGAEIKYQASAATTILYKRMFGADPEDFLKKRAERLKDIAPDLKDITVRYAEIKDRPDDDPEKRSLISKLTENKEFAAVLMESFEFWKQYSFICWLEANEDPRNINKRLNVDEYTFYIMQFTEAYFIANTGAFQALHDGNLRQTSNPKN